MDICGSDNAKARICAVPVRGEPTYNARKRKIRRLDSIQAIGNHNGCKHGISGLRGDDHAYRRGGIWILDNSRWYPEANHFDECYRWASNL